MVRTLSGMEASIDQLTVAAYTIPTDAPEADGTYVWNKTTLVLVEVQSGAHRGIGYTYANVATAQLIDDLIADVVRERDALAIPAAWIAMNCAVRNLGKPGITAMAISAVDSALWDLKAKLLDLPLVTLLGAAHDAVPLYGSGGFTSYTIEQLCDQLGNWVSQGISRVKMKIGTHPNDDPERVAAARDAIGPDAELFVDANGAYTRKQALSFAEVFAEQNVSWFEEPVSSDDLNGLRLLRDRAPAGINIAAGEYGYTLDYFSRMLKAGAVDVLQADATRCGGITGFMGVVSLCQAHHMQLSAHCAPSLHVHPCCATPPLRHLEYFHDHVRIEQMLFDGALTPHDGALYPDLSRPGLGLAFKHADAERFLVWSN
jgi:L-alanine-DL-glutamate epimerase-like enolase superfamily enzyme